MEKVEGEADLLPLHIRLVQGLQVLEQAGEGERFGFRFLQVGELPVRLGEMYQAFPLALDRVESADGLADRRVGDLLAAFDGFFCPEIGEERAGKRDDRSDRVHDLVRQDAHQPVPRFIFLPVQFAVELLPFVFGHQPVYAVESGVQAALFAAADVFGEVEHGLVVFYRIQEELYPPVVNIEIVDEIADHPGGDEERHDAEYDRPPRHDACRA